MPANASGCAPVLQPLTSAAQHPGRSPGSRPAQMLGKDQIDEAFKIRPGK